MLMVADVKGKGSKMAKSADVVYGRPLIFVETKARLDSNHIKQDFKKSMTTLVWNSFVLW